MNAAGAQEVATSLYNTSDAAEHPGAARIFREHARRWERWAMRLRRGWGSDLPIPTRATRVPLPDCPLTPWSTPHADERSFPYDIDDDDAFCRRLGWSWNDDRGDQA